MKSLLTTSKWIRAVDWTFFFSFCLLLWLIDMRAEVRVGVIKYLIPKRSEVKLKLLQSEIRPLPCSLPKAKKAFLVSSVTCSCKIAQMVPPLYSASIKCCSWTKRGLGQWAIVSTNREQFESNVQVEMCLMLISRQYYPSLICRFQWWFSNTVGFSSTTHLTVCLTAVCLTPNMWCTISSAITHRNSITNDFNHLLNRMQLQSVTLHRLYLVQKTLCVPYIVVHSHNIMQYPLRRHQTV